MCTSAFGNRDFNTDSADFTDSGSSNPRHPCNPCSGFLLSKALVLIGTRNKSLIPSQLNRVHDVHDSCGVSTDPLSANYTNRANEDKPDSPNSWDSRIRALCVCFRLCRIRLVPFVPSPHCVDPFVEAAADRTAAGRARTRAGHRGVQALGFSRHVNASSMTAARVHARIETITRSQAASFPHSALKWSSIQPKPLACVARPR